MQRRYIPSFNKQIVVVYERKKKSFDRSILMASCAPTTVGLPGSGGIRIRREIPEEMDAPPPLPESVLDLHHGIPVVRWRCGW
jgi:hypothetical protein